MWKTKKKVSPKKQNKTKKENYATNNAVRHFIMQHTITFLLFKPFTIPIRWMCNSIPYMQHQICMYTAFMQTGPDGPAYCPTCVKCEHFRYRKKVKILSNFSSCYCRVTVSVAVLMKEHGEPADV